MRAADHRAAVDQLLDDRTDLADELAWTRSVLARVAKALECTANNTVNLCSHDCPSIEPVAQAASILYRLALRSTRTAVTPDWPDLVADAVVGQDDDD